MKILLLSLLLICLSLVASAQKAIDSIKVSITASEIDPLTLDLAAGLRGELKKESGVVFVSETSRHHYNIVLVTGTNDGGGFVAALLITDARGGNKLSIHSGESVKILARHLADKLRGEFLKKE